MKNKFLLPLAILVLTASVPAQQQPKSAAPSASRRPALEAGRAARIDQLLQRYVDENRIRLPEGKRPAKAQLLVSGTSPRVQNSAGSISLTVPSIRDHEVIAVDLVR